MRMTPDNKVLDFFGAPLAPVDISLTHEQARLGMAFHEAGHAVLAMAYGMHVASAEVIAWENDRGGWSLSGNTVHEAVNTPPWRFAAMCAGGERAQLRYLHKRGLWTPERAAACAADHDREQAIAVLAQFGYRLGRDHTPEGGKSWATICAVADRTVRLLWAEIALVAHAMDARTLVTGEEIADLTGLANAPYVGGAQ